MYRPYVNFLFQVAVENYTASQFLLTNNELTLEAKLRLSAYHLHQAYIGVLRGYLLTRDMYHLETEDLCLLMDKCSFKYEDLLPYLRILTLWEVNTSYVDVTVDQNLLQLLITMFPKVYEAYEQVTVDIPTCVKEIINECGLSSVDVDRVCSFLPKSLKTSDSVFTDVVKMAIRAAYPDKEF